MQRESSRAVLRRCLPESATTKPTTSSTVAKPKPTTSSTAVTARGREHVRR